MKIFNSLAQFHHELVKLKNPVITIGNFDGFHLGHQELFKQSQCIANLHGVDWGVLTFNPHPKSVLLGVEVQNLFGFDQRIQGFRDVGASFVIMQKFDDEFRVTSKEQFLDNFYIDPQHKISAVVVGKNFRFGMDRRGTTEHIEIFGNQHQIESKVCEYRLDEKNGVVSSTMVRNALYSSGNIVLANRYLGRNYCVTGIVIEGRKIGRSINIPTANLADIQQLLPHIGVYSGWCRIDDVVNFSCFTPTTQMLPAVVNIGNNPTVSTVNAESKKVEVHIIDKTLPYDALYGKYLTFYFLDRIRDEIRFESLASLQSQIGKDIEKAKSEVFGNSCKISIF